MYQCLVFLSGLSSVHVHFHVPRGMDVGYANSHSQLGIYMYISLYLYIYL